MGQGCTIAVLGVAAGGGACCPPLPATPGRFPPLQLRGVDLGPAPPRVTAVKAVRPTEGGQAAGVQEELSFDCSFAWSSKMEGGWVGGWVTCEQAVLASQHRWLHLLFPQALHHAAIPLRPAAVKLLVSLLPAQQAELQHSRGLLRQAWGLLKRAIVVKVGLLAQCRSL